MKIKQIAILTLIMMCLMNTIKAQTYDKLWKEVEQAQKKSLPQTVTKLTDQIYEKAAADKDMGQMLKAYVTRMRYQDRLTPDSFYVNLKQLQQWEMAVENPVDKAVVSSLVMSVYADYASNNFWQLNQRRDIVDEAAADDIRLWTPNQFVEVVLKYALLSLQPQVELSKVSSRHFTPFVIMGESSGYYHHSMYQLLGSRAVSALDEMRSLKKGLELTATIDSIYRQMIDACDTKELEDGRVLTSLDYLQWKNNNNKIRPIVAKTTSILPQTEYLAGLDSLLRLYPHRLVCAEVYRAKAQYALRNEQPAIALQLCDEGLLKYPNYKRINELRNLRETILRPVLNTEVENVAYPNAEVKITVNYKNINGFTVKFLQKKKVISTQQVMLNPTLDYRMSDTTVYVKAPALGSYRCEIVPNGESKKMDAYDSQINVTCLKLLSIALPDNKYQVVVLDAMSGQPIDNATVKLLNDNEKVIDTYTTDKDGMVKLVGNGKYQNIVASKGEDTAMPEQRFYKGGYFYSSASNATEKVQLITDRTLYRPGQTIYVKGIAYSQQGDTASVIVNRPYTLILRDANRQEIAKRELTTNDFGSFTTQLVLPAACLNGRFTLSTDRGSTSVQVEDYKLPTFEITFDNPDVSYTLGDTVALQGVAKSLNGVALQEVPVSYSVYRLARRWWFEAMESGDLVTTGEVNLNEEGGFTIDVPLVAPANIALGYYTYKVEASATSLSGETQSANFTINVGTRSMMLNAEVPEMLCKQKMPELTIKASNLDAQPLDVKGGYKLYSLPEGVTAAQAKTNAPILSNGFEANQPCAITDWSSLPSGRYLVVYAANDNQGREVCGENEFILFSLTDSQPPVPTAEWYYALNTEFDAASPATFYYGTSKQDAFVMMKAFSGRKLVEDKILHLSDSIERFEIPYKEEYGDGMTLLFCFVKDNTVYQRSVSLKKKTTDKNLSMKWDVFRDKLRPGEKEEWKLTIKTPQDNAANAEMLALMYDTALDQLYPNEQTLRLFYGRALPRVFWTSASVNSNYFRYASPLKSWKVPAMSFDSFTSYSFFSDSGLLNEVVIAYGVSPKNRRRGDILVRAASAMTNDAMMMEYATAEITMDDSSIESKNESLPEATSDLRINFSETAFFYPQLRTNEQGDVSFSFTMPENLTRWSFRGFSHTQGMLTGNMQASAITSKEFMLMPNMPRFVRVGDEVTIAATITNLTEQAVSGVATMTLFDPLTDKVISSQKTNFAVDAGKITSVSLGFAVSDKYEMLGCRMVANGDTFSDGEQRVIPVLSNKIHLTETVAMPIRGKESRTFSLEKLFNQHSSTATNRSLTVEFTGNPVWYAVQALPSVALPENSSAISWAAAFYANSLASWIMEQQPRIKTMFEAWKANGGTKDALLSNLQKNQELKNILLSESPWVLDAKSEQEQKERIATLFDVNNVAINNISALNRLKELQLNDGSWAWYKGMSGSLYITQFVTELNARLMQLTGKPLTANAQQMQKSAMSYLHEKVLENYRIMTASERKEWAMSSTILKYLYIVAMSNDEVPASNTTAYQYYISKLGGLLQGGSMASKAQAAIVLSKAGRNAEAMEFIASLKEHLSTTDEMGMFFAFDESPYNWGGLQIPAHVLVMEAFKTVATDDAVVEEMKIWLLKQKQTQTWDSPIASVDAIYALLMGGANMLDNQGDVRIQVGNQVIRTAGANATAGLGYVKDTYTNTQVVDAKNATVTKRDEGIAWGAIYAQYQEEVSKVHQQGGEMNVDKKLYVERIVDNVKQMVPVTASTQLLVGDVVVSRLAITLDRAMDFVQLKDQRAACFEPMASISGYRWNNGFGYYVDIKDASTSFFFDGLGKGVYVLEYSYRVSRGGTYQSGIATIQSAYAPEYASHSSSMKIVAKE